MAELEERVGALETIVASIDRDVIDLGVKVDANRNAINALGLQTAGRFDQVDERFDQVDQRFDRVEQEMRNGFAEMRTGFAATAAGFTEVRGEVGGGLAEVRTEMGEGFAEVRGEMSDGFTEIRGSLAQTAAGQQQIVDVLNTLVDRE